MVSTAFTVRLLAPTNSIQTAANGSDLNLTGAEGLRLRYLSEGKRNAWRGTIRWTLRKEIVHWLLTLPKEAQVCPQLHLQNFTGLLEFGDPLHWKVGAPTDKQACIVSSMQLGVVLTTACSLKG